MSSLTKITFLFIILFTVIYMIILLPIPKEGEINSDKKIALIIGWEYNVTRKASQYISSNISSKTIPANFCDQNTTLLIFVVSSPSNFGARDAIRSTWGQTKELNEQNASLVFILGQPKFSRVQFDVDLEVNSYGDIIQEQFLDTYNNLTLKSLAVLKATKDYCTKTAKFILKVDDDVYTNLSNTIGMLNQLDNTKNVLLGRKLCKVSAIRDRSNKWYAPKYMYPKKKYPDYISGPAYVMSADVAVKLYKAAIDTPIFHLEDVYITGLCATKAKIAGKYCETLDHTKTKNLTFCEIRERSILHSYTANHIFKMYDKLVDPKLSANCSTLSPLKLPEKKTECSNY